jgi:hypothetical protein
MKHLHSFETFINESKKSIIDYSKSKSKILVGLKTNLLKDMKDRYEFQKDGSNIHFFNDKGHHFGTLFDVGTRYQELMHDGSIDNYGWIKESQRHKPVNHIENTKLDDGSDIKSEEEIQKYVEDNADYCPRCSEHISDCQCDSKDPWSTQNYHRVPKGEVKKSEEKQKFKKE